MKPIRIYDSDNDLMLRDGVILAFFCQRPFPEMASAVKSVFEAWLEIIPENILKWSMIGENTDKHKPINKRTISRCFSQLDAEKALKRDISTFEIQGEENYCPDFRFMMGCDRDMKEDYKKDHTNVVEMLFPAEFLQKLGTDAFVDFAIKMAEYLPYDSGYASLSLNWTEYDSDLFDARDLIAPLALRYPGFDVHRNWWTRLDLGRRCRGAYWLTFLSRDLINVLGGRKFLDTRLDQGITILEAGQGLALRAGSYPETGGFDQQKNIFLLRSMAQAIKEVTYFGDTLFSDSEGLELWEQRFLD